MPSEIRIFKNRREAYRRYCPGKVCVEIGVFKGKNARQIWEAGARVMYLVDAWEGFAVSGDENGDNMTRVHLPTQLAECMAQMPFANFIIGKSPEALDIITEPFDFVYIDGDHRYKAVMDDLNATYAMAAPGAVIGGHDYSHRTPGVMRAVDEFCKARGLRINAITQGRIPSYFIET